MNKEEFYEKIGLKAGIEIHQQLDTHKLFCNCPSKIKDDKTKPDLRITRYLRIQAGELGQVDKAAKFEFSKNKRFVYNFYEDCCCLVELDEEPPHEINEEALRIALEFSKLVNARINDVVQVMRKTVIDGSNTSGFQRTALIAVNGFVIVENERIPIQTICLEEDAAKIVEKKSDETIFNLSRLGIPLLEIATAPTLKTPAQVKKVAEHIGILLRSLKVKRGLGTIRQDVNVSIRNGSRVEIKGAQDLRALSKIVEIEAHRQLKLLEIKKEIEKRNIRELETRTLDVTDFFKKTNSKLIRKSVEKGNVVIATKINKFNGLLGFEIMPGKRLGTELAMHCKLFGLKGLIHSDELPNYGISAQEFNELKKKLNCSDEDAFILITGSKDVVEKALEDIIDRLKQCFVGVPKEVRRVEADFTTSFLRPMPGSARMYPETDIPLIKPPKDVETPKTVFERIKDYEKLGISSELSKTIALSKKRDFFDKLIKKYTNIEARTIAQILFLKVKDMKTRLKLDTSKLTEEVLEEIIKALNSRIITTQSIEKIVEEFTKGKSVKEAIMSNKKLSDGEVRRRIKEILMKNKTIKNKKALIGVVMKELRGKAEGSVIVKIIEEVLNSGQGQGQDKI